MPFARSPITRLPITRLPITRLIVTALSLLLLATPSFAQDNYDWAERVYRPADGWLDFPHGSKAAIEAEPCCGSSFTGKWPDPSEAPLLKQLAGKAARDDTVLRLALDGGRSLKITDCRDADVCKAQAREHRLVGWWPGTRHYIVRVYVGGPPWFDLISQKDGSSTSVIDVPLLSPSGRYAIAFRSGPVTDLQINVIDLATDPPKVVDVAPPPCAAFDNRYSLLPPNPVWADDNHVRFEGDMPWLPPDSLYRRYTGKALLRIGHGPNLGRPQWEC
jgi:hypothetical protein